jgi:hypothetical protein
LFGSTVTGLGRRLHEVALQVDEVVAVRSASTTVAAACSTRPVVADYDRR